MRKSSFVNRLISTLTCPQCGKTSKEKMPTEACQYFYDGSHCGAVLSPIPGDCCLFCSYSDVPRPLVQNEANRGQPARCGGGACHG
ncbi:MAG TPA: GDCCVxC domain-containing (seleno)protein [Sphingomicrobium sp.]|nr:GDCCVxC domain-containing (seleno)protein [Sphingomicrobium sp.]